MTRATKQPSAALELRVATDLSLPADKVVTEKCGWLGRTGSGKTYAAMQLAERMLDAGVQVVALDPVGVWAGLRMDGPAWPVYILGGLYGDLPLRPDQGAEIARLLVRDGLSAVLDVSQFETQGDLIRFAEAFATELFNAKKRAPGAMHVFLEEAQEFVPQNAEPREARMLRAWERLWKLGRNYGVGGSLISQRPQELNKKALNQAGLMFVFCLTGPQERKAVEYWMSEHGADKSLAQSLPKIRVGEPYLWAPGLDLSRVVAIPPKRSRDVSQTPKVGETIARRKTSAIDVEGLRAALEAEAPETVSKAEAPSAAAAEAFQRAQALEQRLHLALAEVTRLQAVEADLRGRFHAIAVQLTGIGGEVAVTGSVDLTTPPSLLAAPAQALPSRPDDAAPRRGGTASDRLLAALASFGPMPEARLLLLAGYTKSGTYFAAMAELRRRGHIVRDGHDLRVTEAGRKNVRADLVESLPSTRQQRIDFWARRFGKAEETILRTLANRPMAERDLLTATGYSKSGTYFAAMATLRKAGLLTGGRGGVLTVVL